MVCGRRMVSVRIDWTLLRPGWQCLDFEADWAVWLGRGEAGWAGLSAIETCWAGTAKAATSGCVASRKIPGHRCAHGSSVEAIAPSLSRGPFRRS
jgi:hypothetical protein